MFYSCMVYSDVTSEIKENEIFQHIDLPRQGRSASKLFSIVERLFIKVLIRHLLFCVTDKTDDLQSLEPL